MHRRADVSSDVETTRMTVERPCRSMPACLRLRKRDRSRHEARTHHLDAERRHEALPDAAVDRLPERRELGERIAVPQRDRTAERCEKRLPANLGVRRIDGERPPRHETRARATGALDALGDRERERRGDAHRTSFTQPRAAIGDEANRRKPLDRRLDAINLGVDVLERSPQLRGLTLSLALLRERRAASSRSSASHFSMRVCSAVCIARISSVVLGTSSASVCSTRCARHASVSVRRVMYAGSSSRISENSS